MEYAVIKTGGKQYKVVKGDTIEIEKIEGREKDSCIFSEVLLCVLDGKVSIGKPILNGVLVKGSIVSQKRGEKIYVSKYKSKVRYRRRTGHRQRLTQVKIEEIALKTKPNPSEKKPIKKTKIKTA